jgi:anti-anti-sigma regulatory factor
MQNEVINVVKEQQGKALVVRLVGSIEESVSFDQLIGVPQAPTDELQINCKGVVRINSVGVKTWIKYFQSLSSRGIKLKFVELSTALVEQMNFISNFRCGGEVESIYVPFACEKCHSELVGLFRVDALKKMQCKIPPLQCSKCGGKAVFDDVPEEYFGFIGN